MLGSLPEMLLQREQSASIDIWIVDDVVVLVCLGLIRRMESGELDEDAFGES
jgi:hypothetical protein